jgi:tetratricopeptide (TPR) repeat protein
MSITLSPADDSRFRKHVRRADLYMAAKQPDQAIASLMAASEANPDHVETRLRIADIHLAADRHNQARDQVMRALTGFIENPRVAVELVQRLNKISESSIIIDIARQLPTPMWESAKSLSDMAQQMSIVGAHELADEFAKAAVARDPDHPPSLSVMARMDIFYGRLDQAAEHAERCLAITPGEPGTHWLLSRLRLPDAGRRIDRIQALIDRNNEPAALATLGYALHNELHDQKDYVRSWEALELACRNKRATLGYEPAQSEALFAALHEWTAEEASIQDGWVDPTLQPIFVVGMHRSGTTLSERIVSGHSRVAAGGETYDITAALRRASGVHCRGETDLRIIKARAGYDYRRIGKEFLDGMRWRAAGAPCITDKLPSNFLNIGFIARALPNARIIRLRRDPIDVGLSNLRTLFSTACQYSYDQMDFVDYFGRYEKLMQHWHAIFPGRILDVEYSDLVAEPEAMARRMAEFCGLPFEPAMVKIEERSDAVATASSVMMRDGIRKDRGKVWKAYETQLQPLIQAFGGG